MRLAWRLQIERAAIGCDRHPRHLHHELHIVFRHRVMHARNEGTLLDHKIETGFGWIRIAPQLGDFEDRLSFVLLVLRNVENGPDDALPAAVLVYVLAEFFVGLDLVAERPILELRYGVLPRHRLDPAREQPRPWMLHRSVGILVRGDIQPARPRRVDLFDDVFDFSKIILAAHLDVIDVHRNPGLFGDLQRLVELLVDLRAFAANMSSVVAAIACDHLGHRDHFVLIFVAAASECGRQIDRTLLHRLRDELRHLVDLGLRRRPVLEADNSLTYLLRRYARSDIDRGTALAEAPEIALERGPVDVNAGAALGFLLVLFEHGAFERGNRLAFPDHIERHTLAHLAFGIPVAQDGHVSVRMQIDETRRNHHPLRVDHALAERGIKFSDPGDAAIFHRHIAVEPGIAAAVDDPAVGDDDIIAGVCSQRPRWTREQREQRKDRGEA